MSHTTLSDAVSPATNPSRGAGHTDSSPTPDEIMQLGLGFWGSKALLSAVQLGLFSELAAAGRLDAEALRERLALHQRSARDFFDALVALGMLERTDGRYHNTDATELFLDRAKPSYVGGILEMANARLYGYWGSLTDGLRAGTPQNEIKTGGNFFDVVYADPAKLRGFLKAMTGISAGAAKAIATTFPWERYETFIDIGCAEGCLPVAVVRAHEHITGGGFDLPAVGPFFDEFAAQAGLGDRLRFHQGDFFSDPLPSADVLCMGHILHDWNLDEKRILLRKAYDALSDGGAMIVYESIIDDQRRENAFGLLMSLTMLIETPGGFDYTGADCQRWMRQIGFRETYVQPLAGPDSMVVGIK
jgi:O-methyltransferase/methyltransferase family protein